MDSIYRMGHLSARVILIMIVITNVFVSSIHRSTFNIFAENQDSYPVTFSPMSRCATNTRTRSRSE
ncbi:hypothetical protein CWO23_21530 [Vibrio splendidus]|nr:hypothetical protein CWO23_21530 [Vibrio splendidus]